MNSSDTAIVLSGYYGFGNLGDEALLWTILRATEEVRGLRRLRYIILGGQDLALPPELRANCDIVTARLPRRLRIVRKASGLIFGGGSQFQDHGELRNCRYIAIQLALALSARRYAGLGLSIGPLQTRIGRILTRLTLRMAAPLVVRDPLSSEFLRRPKVVHKLAPDLAFAGYLRTPATVGGVNVVGLSLLPFSKQTAASAEEESRFMAAMRRALSVLQSERSTTFVGLPFQRGVDAHTICSVLESCDRSLVSLLSLEQGPDAALATMGNCSALVAMRFHALVFGALLGLPMLVIPYHQKVRLLAHELGLHKEAVLEPTANPSSVELLERLRALLDGDPRFVPTINIASIQERARESLRNSLVAFLDSIN